MAYYPDFSEYRYHQAGIKKGTVNIGWLEARCDFTRGTPSKEFLSKLWQYCKIPFVQTRGFHDCPFCKFPANGIQRVEFEGEVLNLGSGELRVFGEDGIIYACPSLIFHYVKDHFYKPPNVFIEAVVSQSAIPMAEYKNKLITLNLLSK